MRWRGGSSEIFLLRGGAVTRVPTGGGRGRGSVYLCGCVFRALVAGRVVQASYSCAVRGELRAGVCEFTVIHCQPVRQHGHSGRCGNMQTASTNDEGCGATFPRDTCSSHHASLSPMFHVPCSMFHFPYSTFHGIKPQAPRPTMERANANLHADDSPR